MVGVVGVGVALPNISALPNGSGDVYTRILDGKVHQGGGAAKEGGAADLLRRCGTQIARPHDRCRDVRVGFDAAGNHHLAGSVNNPANFFGQGIGGGHRDNLFTLDRHVPVAYAPGCDYLPIAN